MENGQKCISDLFESRRIFNIPKYQRAYAWEQKQLEDFIKDLDNQSLDKDYFLGTLLLQIADNEGHFKIVDIVDGQQRLTTIVIFLRFLLEKLRSYGDDVEIPWESYIQYRSEYKLRVLEYDQEFFRQYILENIDINNENDNVIQTPSQRRLLQAKKFFIKELNKRTAENLRELQKKLENAKILTYAVEDNAEATLIFETHNDRGKPLTSLEKLKSFLMYKVYITADEPEKYLKMVQSRFGEIYRKYEEMHLKWNLSEDMILRQHYITFEAKSTDNIDNYSQHFYLIKEKITKLSNNQELFGEATEFIDQYTSRLMETFRLFAKLSLVIGNNANLLNLFDLDRSANFYPLLIAVLKQCDDNHKLNELREVAKLLEIISFRIYGIRKRKLNNRTILKRLYSFAQNFTGNFEDLLERLKDLIGEFCSNHEFQERLSQPNLYENLKNNDLIYLLWQYENYLRIHEYSKTVIGFRQFKSLAIEHIVPQTPKYRPDLMYNPSQWEQIHSIGNLVIDLSYENSAKSNYSFETKYNYFYKNSRFYSQRELIDFYNEEAQEWDNFSIQKRATKIINFALNYWDHNSVCRY